MVLMREKDFQCVLSNTRLLLKGSQELQNMIFTNICFLRKAEDILILSEKKNIKCTGRPYIHYSGLQMLSFSFPNGFIKIDSFFIIPKKYDSHTIQFYS